MRIRTLVRIAPGAWLTPMMLGLIVLYAISTVTFEQREPYALYLTARAMNALGLIVPVFAGAAAWEGARLRRAGIWQLPFVRSRLVVAAWSMLPALFGGTCVLVAVAMAVLSPQGLIVPDAVVLGAAITILSAQVAFGFFLGTVLPRALAIPVVVLGSFLTFVLPRVAGPAWVRHMSGTTLELCCTTDQTLDLGVAISILAISVALVAAATLLIGRHVRARTALVVVIASVLLASLVASAAAPPTKVPSVPRAGTADLCATRDAATVCVWPEHRELLPLVTDVAAAAVLAWRSAGVVVPETFHEGDVDHGAARISLRTGMGRDQLLEVLAGSIASPFPSGRDEPPCAARKPWPSAIAGPYVWTWLALEAGISRQNVDAYFEGGARPDSDYFPDTPGREQVPVLPLVRSVRRLPAAAQAAWVQRNLDALGRCATPAPLDPG